MDHRWMTLVRISRNHTYHIAGRTRGMCPSSIILPSIGPYGDGPVPYQLQVSARIIILVKFIQEAACCHLSSTITMHFLCGLAL